MLMRNAPLGRPLKLDGEVENFEIDFCLVSREDCLPDTFSERFVLRANIALISWSSEKPGLGRKLSFSKVFVAIINATFQMFNVLYSR